MFCFFGRATRRKYLSHFARTELDLPRPGLLLLVLTGFTVFGSWLAPIPYRLCDDGGEDIDIGDRGNPPVEILFLNMSVPTQRLGL